MRRVAMSVAVFISLLVLSGMPLPVAAQPTPPPLPSNVRVVAAGLMNPRGMVLAADGSLIITEAGRPPEGFQAPGGPPSATFRPGTALAGRVSRVDLASGERTVLVDGLPTSSGSFGDTIGAAAVAYVGSDLYVLISAGPAHGWPNYPSGVYKANADGTTRLVANLDAFNAKNPVALIPPDDEISNPYGMISDGAALWVTDGNRNQVYRVGTDGTVTRVADLSSAHPVTTGIALSPNGGVLVSELTAVPYLAGAGRVLHLDPAGAVSTMAKGTTTATGIAAAPDGGAYVTELSASVGPPAFLAPFTGRVIRVSAAGDVTPIVEGLMFPTQAMMGPDGGLYVVNFSMGSDHGEGQILRIDLGSGM